MKTREEIMFRLHEHYEEINRLYRVETVGIFLQGSQNYGLATKNSDIDSKVIIIPSIDDIIFNRKPISTTHIMPNNEHVDLKDIRLMFQCFEKQNVNFLEILFSKYIIMNPVYETLF